MTKIVDYDCYGELYRSIKFLLPLSFHLYQLALQKIMFKMMNYLRMELNFRVVECLLKFPLSLNYQLKHRVEIRIQEIGVCSNQLSSGAYSRWNF